MKKRISIILSLLTLVLFSFTLFAGCGDKKANKQKYEMALNYIAEGNQIEAYKLLFESKDYELSKEKLDELLLENYYLQYIAAEPGFTVEFGRYEQDDDTENGSEALEWKVLKKENGKLMLASNKIIEYKPLFNSSPGKNPTWEQSVVFKWLNDDFYKTAFLEGERDKIVETFILSDEEYIKQQDNINCKVFLLTNEELLSGFENNEDYYLPFRNYVNEISHTKYAERLCKQAHLFEDNCKYLSSRTLTYDGTRLSVRSALGTTYDYGSKLGIAPVIWIEI